MIVMILCIDCCFVRFRGEQFWGTYPCDINFQYIVKTPMKNQINENVF